MSSGGERPLYAVLGVAPDATAEAVKQSYRRLALQNHPDKCRGSEQEKADTEATFARLAFAYEVLGHESRRKRYDLTGEVPQSDTATGRSASDTFLKEYMQSAPKATRVATQAGIVVLIVVTTIKKGCWFLLFYCCFNCWLLLFPFLSPWYHFDHVGRHVLAQFGKLRDSRGRWP